MNSFHSDLAFGVESEKLLSRALKREGFTPEQSFDGTCDVRYDVKVEVKTDREWQRTGNVAVEFKYRDKPSGISTTEAHIYVYVLDGVSAFWYVGVDELKTFLKNTVCKRVKGGDNNMSDLILLTLSQFFSIFKRL